MKYVARFLPSSDLPLVEMKALKEDFYRNKVDDNSLQLVTMSGVYMTSCHEKG